MSLSHCYFGQRPNQLKKKKLPYPSVGLQAIFFWLRGCIYMGFSRFWGVYIGEILYITVSHPWMIHHPCLIHFCILYSFPKSSSLFLKQYFLTTYTYQQVFHKISSQLKVLVPQWNVQNGFSVDFSKNALTLQWYTCICKFLHNNTTESSEIWRDGSHWLTEIYYAVFMGKTYCLELKFEFNDFTVSLRGGWLWDDCRVSLQLRAAYEGRFLLVWYYSQ